MRLKKLGLYVSGALGMALVVACSASTEEPTADNSDAISVANAANGRFDPDHPSFAAEEWLAKLQGARKNGGDAGVIAVLKGYLGFAATKSPGFVKTMAESASILDVPRANVALAQLLHKGGVYHEAVVHYDVALANGGGQADLVSVHIARAEADAEIEMGDGVVAEDIAKRAKIINALIGLEREFAGKPEASRFTYNILLGESYSNIVDLPRARLVLGEVKFERTPETMDQRAFAGTKLYLAKKQFELAGLSTEASTVRTQMDRFDNVFGTDFRGVNGGVTVPDDD